MDRRDWLKATGALAGIAAVRLEPSDAAPAELRTEIVRLKLRHTWTTTMSSSEFRDTLHVRYTRDGVTGWGEGAPIVRYHEDAQGARDAVESLRALLVSSDPWTFDKLTAEVGKRLEGQYAARAAIDVALLDWVGRRLGVPLHRQLGLDPKDAPLTTFSIGIDTPDATRHKVREAEAFPVLKIKVGLDSDEATLAAVRSVTRKPLRVDANEGWKDKETAVRKLEWLATQGVELVEQPLPAALLEETRWLRKRVELPIFADEACLRAKDVPGLAGAYDGVNVKLDKAGGVLEALRMIHVARALGMKVMLGCMVSSSVSVTAAAHISPLVDYADLDGNLLIANDPCRGVAVRQGRLVLPDGPGLGLREAASEEAPS
jgi:L-alanine-DL-glutamate epimerase-like enolase superfamily enzyme